MLCRHRHHLIRGINTRISSARARQINPLRFPARTMSTSSNLHLNKAAPGVQGYFPVNEPAIGTPLPKEVRRLFVHGSGPTR